MPQSRAKRKAWEKRFSFIFGRATLWATLRKTAPTIEEDKRTLISISPLKTIAAADVETLLDKAFGPGRKERTAYRLRDGVAEIDELSFAARDEPGRLVGSIQCWPVQIRQAPMVLVGPVAVSPDAQRGGIGKQLMTASLNASIEHGHDALMMIGDPEYYERFFGFSALETQDWELPGPFERHRLLARITRPGGVPTTGLVGPNPAFARTAPTA